MTVNWSIFERNITDAIKSRKAKNENDFANLIADEYDSAIVNYAQDMVLGNRVSTTNKNILVSALKGAFLSAKTSSNKKQSQDIMKSFINSGILAYWMGAQLTLFVPPPGAVSVVSNVVSSPGVPPNVKIENISDVDVFVKELSTKLQLHLLTVGGVTSGVSPQGAPIVIPFNGLN